MLLHNRVNKEELKKRLYEEAFTRRTISFYRYFNIPDPQEYRDRLYMRWSELNCFGRIYVAREGLNAQMSVPEDKLPLFLQELNTLTGLEDIPVKYAIEDDGLSFYKLTIKVREKIVADGFEHDDYDFTNVGKHLSALEFHQMAGEKDVAVVDMRNHYEYEGFQQVKQLGIESKFTGKNFVFDERLGESVDGKVIAACHQCGAACDTHTNCANDDCHQLFIQCKTCSSKYEGCCSSECQDIFHLPPAEQLKYRGLKHKHYSQSKIYNRIGGYAACAGS